MKELDYKLLKALSTVVSEQSFEGAAKKLYISQSAVSQRIKLLEESFASPVLIRTTPLVTTELGSRLLNHYHQISQLETSFLEDIALQDKNTPTKIAIALNADSLATWFIPAISPLLKQHNIELDFYVTNEAHTQSLLKKGEVYSALSCQPLGVTNSKITHIGDITYKLCASPAFYKQYFGGKLTTKKLRLAPGINYDQYDKMHENYIQTHFNLSQSEYPCHRVRSSEAFLNLTLNGLAYSLLPHNQAEQYLSNGELIDLLPNKHLIMPLYWHSWILEKGVQKLLTDHVVAWGEEHFNGNTEKHRK